MRILLLPPRLLARLGLIVVRFVIRLPRGLRKVGDIVGAGVRGPSTDNRGEYLLSKTRYSSHRQSDSGLPMRRR